MIVTRLVCNRVWYALNRRESQGVEGRIKGRSLLYCKSMLGWTEGK